MDAQMYEIRVCRNPDCGLRYPLIQDHPFGQRCPVCLGDTQVVLKRELASGSGPAVSRASQTLRVKRALLDNIRSSGNVGAIFRTAEAFGLQELYLCGITPTPENQAIRKTSMGMEDVVAWKTSRNALQTAESLQQKGFSLLALEQDCRAVTVKNLRLDKLHETILVVGNEISGVDPDLLDLCDQILYLPMHGRIRSLNVSVAFGIGLSQLLQR